MWMRSVPSNKFATWSPTFKKIFLPLPWKVKSRPIWQMSHSSSYRYQTMPIRRTIWLIMRKESNNPWNKSRKWFVSISMVWPIKKSWSMWTSMTSISIKSPLKPSFNSYKHKTLRFHLDRFHMRMRRSTSKHLPLLKTLGISKTSSSLDHRNKLASSVWRMWRRLRSSMKTKSIINTMVKMPSS